MHDTQWFGAIVIVALFVFLVTLILGQWQIPVPDALGGGTESVLERVVGWIAEVLNPLPW